MSDLNQLYQELILDHSRNPRNFGKLDDATHRAEGYNPLCGDQLELELHIDADGRVSAVQFIGKGCAISTASASLLTEALKGKSASEADALFEQFHSAITSPADQVIDVSELGKLAALIGVREFPMRVKCASLAWHTMCAAMRGDAETITTE